MTTAGIDTDTQLVVPRLHEITGKQIGVLADARKLDEIVGGSSYNAVVFNLVDWAKRSNI